LKSERALKWAETRSKGKWHFVWRVGVLQWGLIMGAIFVGMQSAQHPSHFLFILGFNLPLWLCFGFFWGLFTWMATEWSYKRHMVRSASGTVGRDAS
jgi:hypothetical protein